MIDKSLIDFSNHLHLDVDLNLLSALIGSLSSLSFIVIAWLRGKRTPLLHCFLVIQLLFFVQYINNLIILFSANWGNNWWYNAIDYLFYCFISPVFLLFVFIFTKNKNALDVRNICRLFIPTVIIYLLLLTDVFHHLFFKVADLYRRIYGPFFWLHYFVALIYLSVGIYRMFKYSLNNYHYIKKQTNIMVTAGLIIIITTIVYIFRLVSGALLIASCGLEITMMLLVWAYYYRFFNITPLALRRIVENMEESIIVVDNYNEINNFNNHFATDFLSWIKIRKTDHIEVFVRKLETVIIPGAESANILNAILSPVRDYVTGELTLNQPKRRTFMVSIHPIFNKPDLIGRVVSFHDISDYKGLLEDYNQKNMELLTLNRELTAMNAEVLTANERLHEYAATVEELAIVKERNRMTRDVHDTLGHTMTLVLTALEVSQISLRARTDKDLEMTKQYLADAAQITRKGITELRNSIRGLALEKITTHNLRSALEKLVSDFQISGIVVDFSFAGSEFSLEPVHAEVIYRICQESLTNSYRHGKATEVSIILRIDDDRMKLYIYDNGCGCKEIKPGFGLNGMKQRVEDLRGRITFGSDGERGFTIHTEIPINTSCENNQQ